MVMDKEEEDEVVVMAITKAMGMDKGTIHMEGVMGVTMQTDEYLQIS